MTPDNFCYWLQGFFEISGATTMTEAQVEMVRNHLDMVFVHAVSQEKVADKKTEISSLPKTMSQPIRPDPDMRIKC